MLPPIKKPSGIIKHKMISATAKQRSARLQRFQSEIQSCIDQSPVVPSPSAQVVMPGLSEKNSTELWLSGDKGIVKLPQTFTPAMEQEMYDPDRVRNFGGRPACPSGSESWGMSC